MKPLFTGTEWTFELLEKIWAEIDAIGKELGLDYYAPQIEIVSAEQMLDAYASNGLPNLYQHWSFGKRFIKDQQDYEKGNGGLAYELVINSNPSIAYLMENNSATMQTLVLAHAVCGHGSFFKSNYLFKDWTDADYILEYMKFAKEYIAECEKKYGEEAVESLLDACHAIKLQGIDKYKRPPQLKKKAVIDREKEIANHAEQNFNDLWRTLPEKKSNSYLRMIELFKELSIDLQEALNKEVNLNHRAFPEENLLYFIEKHSRYLEDWEKEILRIVRKIEQYFYPQMQTKLMNEGWASFVHHEIMNIMFDRGLITEGAYLEFIHSHCGVIYQPPRQPHMNPYALGIAIFQDLKRLILEPDEEDKEYFPDLAGKKDYWPILIDIMKNYRDESFVLQFLSPKLIRKFKLMSLYTDETCNYYEVDMTHEDYDMIRKLLSKEYAINEQLPQIEIVGVDAQDYGLNLVYTSYNGEILEYNSAKKILGYLEELWGEPVYLDYRDPYGREIKRVRVEEEDENYN